ncbi:ribonuclease H-like domain, reverse transcriptase, RNA-dependent DNA polymerase [Tanacetum coccineum]
MNMDKGRWGTAVKPSAGCAWINPLKDRVFRIVYCGCSRCMTSNKEEFQLPENSQVVLRVPRRTIFTASYGPESYLEKDVTCLLGPNASLITSLAGDLFGPHFPSEALITSSTHWWLQMVISGLLGVMWTKPHNKTPYELVSGKFPPYLKPFGCLVTILTSDHLGKFEGKADEGFIVGLCSLQQTNHLQVILFMKLLKMPVRNRVPAWSSDFCCGVSDGSYDTSIPVSNMFILMQIHHFLMVTQWDSVYFLQDILPPYDMAHSLWQLVPLPDGKIAIGTKWILKNKRDARGIVVRNKARLVAQGHRQEEGIIMDEVFALLLVLLTSEAERHDEDFISQDKYVQDMLKKFDMESVRPATTPFEASKPKSTDKPDDAVNFKKIFKYLKGQPKLGLWYPRDSPFVLEAYSDSDYAGSHGDRKSTTGGCQFLGRRLISWQCKKQTNCGTFMILEAEYVAAAKLFGQCLLWCCKSSNGSLRVPTGRTHSYLVL